MPKLTVTTRGGPRPGVLEMDATVLGYPPPAVLPGVFHGGSYGRRSFATVAHGDLVAEYVWAPNVYDLLDRAALAAALRVAPGGTGRAA